MKVMTFHVPEEWVQMIDKLVNANLVPSKAEFIRCGMIKEFRAMKVLFPAKKDLLPLLEGIEDILGESK